MKIESIYPTYDPIRLLQYVENECKSLVNQINNFFGKVGE